MYPSRALLERWMCPAGFLASIDKHRQISNYGKTSQRGHRDEQDLDVRLLSRADQVQLGETLLKVNLLGLLNFVGKGSLLTLRTWAINSIHRYQDGHLWLQTQSMYCTLYANQTRRYCWGIEAYIVWHQVALRKNNERPVVISLQAIISTPRYFLSLMLHSNCILSAPPSTYSVGVKLITFGPSVLAAFRWRFEEVQRQRQRRADQFGS